MKNIIIMMCFHRGPLVKLRMLSVIFLTSFFIGLRRICLRAKVHNLVFFICSLFTGTDCVTDKLKAIFS